VAEGVQLSKKFYQALGKTVLWPELPHTSPASLSYDDVILVPQNSSIRSRADVSLEVQFGPYTLTKPIISAPMDTVSGEKMVRLMAKLGALGSLPAGALTENLALCEQFSSEKIPCLYAITLKNAFENAKKFKERGAKIILIDIAYGGIDVAREVASEIKKKLKLSVVLGNIVTYDQAQSYKDAGVDIARVGIGPGAFCTTRLVAGSGLPQLSAVFDTSSAGLPIIADGGIRYPGDAAKAIAAGATSVMIGGLLAGTDESPGEIIDGKKYARGQASLDYMKDRGLTPSEVRAAEGISTMVNYKGPAEIVINNLIGGIRSAMSYSGAKNIAEFQERALFALVSDSSQREGQPHILKQ
jgi:IMP dehydrogenase